MKTKLHYFFVALTLLTLSTLNSQLSTAHAQGTAFTYQGRLNSGGSPANGLYDFRFKLDADALGNTGITGYVLTNGVPVTNGLFVVTIDFGTGIFNGSNYWLDVEVRTNNPANTLNYTMLTPLQAVTPTPYAIFANTASNVVGSVSSASLSGTYGSALTLNNAGNSFSGSYSGNGANVTNVNAATLSGLSAGNFWQLGGNTVSAGQFLGSTNNQPVEIRVNGGRALRLEPGGASLNLGNGIPTGAPNVIGGSPVNFVAAGVVGATIGGGGATNYNGNIYTNNVTFDFGTVGGGRGNTAGGYYDATVGGGAGNTASTLAATVSGGQNNTASGNHTTVGGGDNNNAINNADTIGGGEYNTASNQDATVGGGNGNTAGGNNAAVGGGNGNTAGGDYAMVGGGSGNMASYYFATVGGGSGNTASANRATVSGGSGNTASGNGAFIGGGGFDGNTVAGNIVQDSAATIGGGIGNTILTGGTYAFIGGGYFNTISGGDATISGGRLNNNNGVSSTIGGGLANYVGDANTTVAGGEYNSASGTAGTVGGGYNNQATNGNFTTVGGGSSNIANGTSATVGGGGGNAASGLGATVGGGGGNAASGDESVVGGGYLNAATNDYATVPGGSNNIAGGVYSFAAGQSARALHQGTFVWADSQSGTFASTGNNQFLIRAQGGVQLDNSTSLIFVANPRQMIDLYNNGTFDYGIGVQASTMYFRAGTNNGVNPGGGFAWYQGGVFNSGQTNSGGGVRLMILDGSGNLLVKGAVTANSVQLSSDRNLKESFTSVSSQAVLDKVATLPITQWNYKTDGKDVQHLGPMAQDFHAAFQLDGTDDKHISVVDEGGVALAAIQGLNQKLDEKDAEIQDLKARLEKLEQLVSQKNEGAK